MSIQHQTLAYLTDKAGQVYETLTLYSRKPEQEVEAMNSTAAAATDGRLFWTLSAPSAEDITL